MFKFKYNGQVSFLVTVFLYYKLDYLTVTTDTVVSIIQVSLAVWLQFGVADILTVTLLSEGRRGPSTGLH